MRRIHVVWFAHQPFFIPDDEVRWRVQSSYLPVVDAFAEREIPLSFALTGALIERAHELEREFTRLLIRRHRDGRLALLGAPAHHPILPWLSTNAARAQIRTDRETRVSIGFPRAHVLWPTELAWSMQVGRLAVEEEYEAVVIDSRSRDGANAVPEWQRIGGRLAAKTMQYPRLGYAHRLMLDVVPARRLSLWVRDAELAHAFVTLIRDNDLSGRDRLTRFLVTLDGIRDDAASPDAPVLLGEDIERVMPDGIAALLQLLDDLQDSGVEFLSAAEFATSTPAAAAAYVPAGTMEGDDALWTQSMDDRCFRQQLDRLGVLMEQQMDLTQPRNEEERLWRDRLLRIQDSGFYFWRYIARTRRPFYDELQEIESWMRSRLAVS